MRRGHNLKIVDAIDNRDLAPETIEQVEERLSKMAPGSLHARQLQSMLVEAYSETSPEEKLPASQRVAIIIGATSALWLLIGAAVYAVI
jgi:hypothetical protein